MAQSKQAITIEGHRIVLTNLDKVLYPETGTTKADVLSYYSAIAPLLLPHTQNRPATRKRWVNGVGTSSKPGKMFFQKNLDESTPTWVTRRPIEHKDHTTDYPLVNNLATLIWLGQIAALEIHVPQWKFGRTGDPRNPDRLVLDLDPGEGTGLQECAEVARYARTILKDMRLNPMPVTSGSKGIHLYVALGGQHTSAEISDVAHELARALEADNPDLVVSDMKRSLRPGKVFVDWSQNNASKTTIAPYSLRGRMRPFVAAPRTWGELASKNLAQLDYEQVLARMKRRTDPLAGLIPNPSDRAESSVVHARARSKASSTPTPRSPAGLEDKLTPYRAKRDAARTSEPVPDGVGSGTQTNAFVIQEHHAQRLHFDFRLEHDGVLVSWAIPKGVPTDPKTNHLAVQTEDHPLEYRSFEGQIPKGEYGAGQVSIWDTGHYVLEKWREGKEIIVTLHGEEGGGLGAPQKVALIHTGSDTKQANNWLIHLMANRSPKANSPGRSKRASTTRLLKQDSHASAPEHDLIAPMLATLGTEADLIGGDWVFEMKWDGLRAIAYLGAHEADVRIVSRTGMDISTVYPDIASQLRESFGAGEAVGDGEIVALNKRSRPDFSLLQKRMGLTDANDIAEASRITPVQYFVFDLLSRAGTELTSESYHERRRQLRELVTEKGAIHVPPDVGREFQQAFRSSQELELEGLIAKKRDSTYSSGRRSKAWIKIKQHSTQEVVIGGWRTGKGRRASTIGSLLLGLPARDGLRYIGRVGTGFTDRELETIAARLQTLEVSKNPFIDISRSESAHAHWAGGGLVAEVEFAEWTPAGRLRQPSWRGWRLDKRTDQVTRE